MRNAKLRARQVLGALSLALATTCCLMPKQSQAILNCFTPNSLRLKGGSGFMPGAGVYHQGYAQQQQQSTPDRASWYATQHLASGGYPQAMSPFQMSPIKSLFVPKWKPSLFGQSKMGWTSGWKHGGLYRPGMFNPTGGAYSGAYGPAMQHGGYPLPEQLNIAPFMVPMSSFSGLEGAGWSAPVNGLVPGANSQQQAHDFDYNNNQYNYDPQQQLRPQNQQQGGTKTPPSPVPQPLRPNQQQQQQTTKNRNYKDYFGTVANDGYGNQHKRPDYSQHQYQQHHYSPNGHYDDNNEYSQHRYSHRDYGLMLDQNYNTDRSFLHRTGLQADKVAGYSYPDWYSGTIDSPAKVMQNLKQNLRNQNIERQQFELIRATMNDTRPFVAGLKSPMSSLISGPLLTLQRQQQSTLASLPLIVASNFSHLSRSKQGEPKFDGLGAVELMTNRVVRLTCSFGEPIDQSDRPLWVKFIGPYSAVKQNPTLESESSTSAITIVERLTSPPPFNCQSNSCRIQEIDTNKDYRFKFENGKTTSTLIIDEPRIDDYGIYRCSALTQKSNSTTTSPETIYQIVQFESTKRR